MKPYFAAAAQRMRLAVLCTIALWLVACGGGSANGPSVPVAAERQSVSAVAPSAAEVVRPSPWTLCALEHQACLLDGTRQVRYGTTERFVVATFTGSVTCSSAVFGDPAAGAAKSCWYASAGTATPPTTGWVACADEAQFCAFAGTRSVRYGSESRYASGTYTDGVLCASSVFGDPAAGIAKRCSYADETTTQTVWIACALENGYCAFAGTRRVRYGDGSTFYTGLFTGGVPCSNATFGDPSIGIVKACSYAADAADTTPSPTPVDPGPSGTNPPVVFNASGSVHAGDLVSLQGEDFGTSPRVYLEGAPDTPLEIVNRVGTTWLGVQIPASAQDALTLRIGNATGVSARITLNGAKPLHLDAMQLVPGGAFRLFGRSLMRSGSTPTITIDGLAATIDASRSDEYMLTATAPTSLRATSQAAILVDNGNGTGAMSLDRTIEVVASAGGDPFGLGVGWAAAFAPIVGNDIDAASDARLSQRVLCNGTDDDSPAIQSAIRLAASSGGGVVRLPAGRCRVQGGMNLQSRVVVRGAGKDRTELVYASNYPVFATGLDLVGVGDLTLTNAGSATEGPLLKDSTRVFVQNVRFNLATSRQMFVTGNRNIAVVGCDFVQTRSIGQQGPYLFDDSAGLVFEGNTTQWYGGAPSFGRVHDSYLHANRFTRDARGQNDASTGTVHSFVMDFGHRVAIVGNTLDVANGPIVNVQRNDGEAILTEGGGASRTENLGTVGSATATTFSDPLNTFALDPFGTGTLPEDYGVAIVGGKGTGQTRRVVAGSGSTLTVDRPWDSIPDASSRYATFVWGFEKSLVKDNVLSQNPRGIWLYHTAIRDVDVVGNRIGDGGGIYLRAYQNLAVKRFMPIYNVVIANNVITNATGPWGSYINAVFVNADARAFGVAMLGIEMRANAITANRPNVYSTWEEYAGAEGLMTMMRVENYASYESSSTPRVLGSILTSNRCTNCDTAVRVATGAGGTTIVNTRLVDTGTALTDWATTSSPERSTDTVIR